MFAVSLFLLLILVVAVTVVLIVALPQIRSGSEIFTEDGKQAVARAGQAARTGPIAVVGGTKQLLRPVSDKLHAQMDRLDERQPRESSGATAGASAGRRSPSSADDADHHAADHHHVVGYSPNSRSGGRPGAAMVGQRPVPEESGPIPELHPADPGDAVAGDVVRSRLDVVIDLREPGSDGDPASTRPIDKPIEHRAGKRTS